MAKLRLSRSWPRFFALPGVAAAALVLPVLAAEGASDGGGDGLRACLTEVARGKDKEIACRYEAFLTDDERADMRRLSRGLLQDATCLVDVRIERRLVEPALLRADHVFEAPPQPVRCTITTKDGGFPVTSTFTPRVVFKGGIAVEAMPGMGDVAGINRYLAWPVVQYVNRAPGIQKAMREMINTLRPRLAEAASKR